jgi:hypothetical protein
MTVRTMDASRIRSLREHLVAAGLLDPDELDRIRDLAAQLADRPVLPLLGAGASFDCGMRLASEIGADLHRDYMVDPAYWPQAAGLAQNLSDVADAISNTAGQVGVVRALGLPDPALWPAADDVRDHRRRADLHPVAAWHRRREAPAYPRHLTSLAYHAAGATVSKRRLSSLWTKTPRVAAAVAFTPNA